MNADLETTEKILRRICCAISLESDPMELRMRDNEEYVKWTATPSSVAAPYLIGNAGRHVKAMQHLVRGFGLADGRTYILHMNDPAEGPKRPWSDKRGDPKFNPEPLLKLLTETLEALGVGEFKIEVLPNGLTEEGAARSTVDIWVRSEEDYQLLVTKTLDGSGRTNIQAIGTLWRACASIAGGKLNVEVKKQ